MGAVILAGKGEYRDWRAIAAIHQRTLTSVITLDGYGITSPKDLEGKEVGASTGSANQLLFPAYARLAGIDASKVKFQNGKTTDLNGWLVTGKVRALTTFLLGQVAIEKAAGGKKASSFRSGSTRRHSRVKRSAPSTSSGWRRPSPPYRTRDSCPPAASRRTWRRWP